VCVINSAHTWSGYRLNEYSSYLYNSGLPAGDLLGKRFSQTDKNDSNNIIYTRRTRDRLQNNNDDDDIITYRRRNGKKFIAHGKN